MKGVNTFIFNQSTMQQIVKFYLDQEVFGSEIDEGDFDITDVAAIDVDGSLSFEIKVTMKEEVPT